MNISIDYSPVVLLAALTLLVSAWTLTPTSANMGDGFVQAAQNLIKNANAMAADHNKLKDCITEAQ